MENLPDVFLDVSRPPSLPANEDDRIVRLRLRNSELLLEIDGRHPQRRFDLKQNCKYQVNSKLEFGNNKSLIRQKVFNRRQNTHAIFFLVNIFQSERCSDKCNSLIFSFLGKCFAFLIMEKIPDSLGCLLLAGFALRTEALLVRGRR